MPYANICYMGIMEAVVALHGECKTSNSIQEVIYLKMSLTRSRVKICIPYYEPCILERKR